MAYDAPVPASPHNLSLSDIARMAGVSPATASRALNNAYGVAPATRKRVLAIAKKMQYVVSPEASGLASGRSGRVAVIVPHMERWFFGTMLAGITAALAQAHRDVLVYMLPTAADRRRFFRDLPARRKVDGVIWVAQLIEPAERRRLELMGVQIIAAGGQDVPYPGVTIDDHEAGRIACQHLVNLGHRRIGVIEAADAEFPAPQGIQPRTRAYQDVLRAAGVEPDPELVRTIDWRSEDSIKAMAELMSLPEPPTAVFCYSDELAFGALQQLWTSGLVPGRDVSVVAVDDHPLSETFGLSTVHQDPRAQGEQAAILLDRLLEGDQTTMRVTAPIRLVPRASTAPLRDG